MAPQLYLRFLIACASDPRFTADTILAEIAKNYRLSTTDRLLYRFVIIPQTRRGILRLKDSDAWMNSRPDWGRGRIDPFNPVKFTIPRPAGRRHDRQFRHAAGLEPQGARRLRVPLGRAEHEPAGSRVVVGDWRRRARMKVGGSRLREVERDRSEASMSSLRRIQNYISSVAAAEVSVRRSTRRWRPTGATVYQTACASCHAFGGTRTGTVIPLDEVGTDRHRLDMWTPASATAYNDTDAVLRVEILAFQNDQRLRVGAARRPLAARAVPAQRVGADARRPARAGRSTTDDVLARVRRLSTRTASVSSRRRDAQAAGTPFDTSLPGNSNAGHLWGTTLDAERKRALIEYLKTL